MFLGYSCLKLSCLLAFDHMLTTFTVDLPPPILPRRHSGQRQIKPHAHDAASVAARRALAREQEQFVVRKQSPRNAYWSGEEAMIEMIEGFRIFLPASTHTFFTTERAEVPFLRCWDGCTGSRRFLPPACNCSFLFLGRWERKRYQNTEMLNGMKISFDVALQNDSVRVPGALFTQPLELSIFRGSAAHFCSVHGGWIRRQVYAVYHGDW